MTLEMHDGRMSHEKLFIPEPLIANSVDLSERAELMSDEVPLQEDSPPPDLETSGGVERDARPHFNVREAVEDDIPRLVEIDLRAFKNVYKGYGMADEKLREDLIDKFKGRFGLLGGKWMPVVTQRDDRGEDRVMGFMTCCPTNKEPEAFESWEKTTDDGKIDTLYNKNGNNMYVVTLSMDPEVRGLRAQNMLFMNQIGVIMEQGVKTAFFESRMPGLKGWVERQCRDDGIDSQDLSDERKMEYAETYFGLTREIKGKKVPRDALLRVYADVGCKLEKVMPNAYKDEPSMDFGVLCTYENPLGKLGRNRFLGKFAGSLAILASRSHTITRKLFG
jgi:hypothetical protein